MAQRLEIDKDPKKGCGVRGRKRIELRSVPNDFKR